MNATLPEVVQALRSARLSASTEHALHCSISDALLAANINHRDEVRLSDRDRIDFMAGSIGIEAKISGGRLAFARQLIRYAEHDEITSLVLVSAKTVSMPMTVGGKPLTVVSVGMGWM